MKRFRRMALIGLVGVLAAAVPRVYSSSRPIIRTLKVVDNDLAAIHGTGIPGTTLWVEHRQRGFEEATASDFGWCAWFNGGVWASLGSSTVVGSNGKWAVTGLDKMVLPAVIVTHDCAGGMYTEFRVASVYGVDAVPTPVLDYFDVYYPSSNSRVPRTRISGADELAVMIADGPNAAASESGTVVDIDEDGVDVCQKPFSCGATITFSPEGGPLGTLLSPSITEHDGSALLTPDQEYPFILTMAQAHKPGGSILAATLTPRTDPLGPTVNVNVDINARLDLSCGGNHFFGTKL